MADDTTDGKTPPSSGAHPSSHLRIYTPPIAASSKDVRYEDIEYLTPEGRRDDDKWAEMIQSANPHQLRVLRKRFAAAAASVIDDYLGDLRKSDKDNAPILAAYANLRLDTATAVENFQQRSEDVKDIMRDESAGKAIDWVLRDEPEFPRIYQEGRRALHYNASEHTAVFEMILGRMLLSKDLNIHVRPLYNLVSMISELTSQLQPETPPPSPPSPRTGKHGRGA